MGAATLNRHRRVDVMANVSRAEEERPSVSVIVPTYRRTRRLKQLLERLSIVEGARGLEVLIVDQTHDAVHDDLRAFSVFFSSLRFLRLEVANVARARNRGALEARADTLLFMDDDMELQGAFFPTLLGSTVSNSRKAVGAVWTDADNSPGIAAAPIGSPTNVQANFLPSGVLVMGRAEFLSVGGFDERLYRYFEDAELSHRLKQSGISLVKDRTLRAIHHDERSDGTWHSPSLREAASTLARQKAYFDRKTGRTWSATCWNLARTIASEARRPAYIGKGNAFSRALALTLALPSALLYARKTPLLCTSAPQRENATRRAVAY